VADLIETGDNEMNRKAAQDRAREEKLSVGDLRQMIMSARFRGGMSKVNPAFSTDEVCDIYEAALAGRDDAEILKAWRPDIHSRHAGAQKPSRDFLQVTNILRDCA
jgi:hypothetical protein